MRRLRCALWPAGLAFGVAAEWVGRPQLIVLDAATGFALLFLGLVAWSRRPGSRAGAIMSAAGFAWFLGTLWAPAVFWHRGPLAQLLISYPGGRLSSRVQRVGTVVAYGYAATDVVAGSDYATIIFALGLVALSGASLAWALILCFCSRMTSRSALSRSAWPPICCGGAGRTGRWPAWWSTSGSLPRAACCATGWPGRSVIQRWWSATGCPGSVVMWTRPAGRTSRRGRGTGRHAGRGERPAGRGSRP